MEEFLETLRKLTEYLESEEAQGTKKVSRSCDITSTELLKERLRRHTRNPRGPREKQSIPLTASQEVIIYSYFTIIINPIYV